MRTKILISLLAINLVLALYGLGRFDGLLAPAYQRTAYLNAQGQAPVIAPPPVAAPKIATQKMVIPPTAPAMPAVAPVTPPSVATTAPAANHTASSTASTTNKASIKTNSNPAPTNMATAAPTQKTTTASSTSKKTNRPTQMASTNYEEPVYEPVRIAPQPAAPSPVRTESPVVSSGTLQRHQVNKNIASMCQNSVGAWLPCH
ncbi:hypothetical protein DTO96_100698 [Ephemeroptericola cinctiostellae]|uniref:Uncharacterized protein n=1 Tax=Ephemeroptericola cinctiostellae TaxID=2268024 RepID=A0A345D9E3_9BURK|nr:hypothetical protein [Ephemeroptericola cinctiostellae]AXF84981.1 hypothetical protein DTO96_100698 [Ephemeroptericola cinctiostellae]